MAQRDPIKRRLLYKYNNLEHRSIAKAKFGKIKFWNADTQTVVSFNSSPYLLFANIQPLTQMQN
jgi:hypothetical protein